MSTRSNAQTSGATSFVSVEGLTKRYRDDLPPVFEHVSFRIEQGEKAGDEHARRYFGRKQLVDPR